MFYKNHNDIIAWLKIRKEFSDFDKDIFIACTYIPPENSTHTVDDVFGLLLNEIASLPDDCEVIVCGDMNARLGTLVEYEKNTYDGSDGDATSLMPMGLNNTGDVFNILKQHNCLNRSSRDNAKPNNYGLELINMCKAANLIILNGRSGFDKLVGNFSSIQPNGNSVTDYVLCSPGIFAQIDKFKVNEKYPESDHVPITFSLKYKSLTDKQTEYSRCTWDPVYRYIWDEHSINSLKDVLVDNISIPFQNKFKESMSNSNQASDVTIKYSEYIQQALKRRLHVKQIKSKPGRPTWYDKECRIKRNEVVKAGKANLADESHKYILNGKCKEYSSLKQVKKRNFKRECLEQIEHTFKNNKTLMWKTVNKFFPHCLSKNNPTGDEFYEYFKTKSCPEFNPNFNYELERTAVQSMNTLALSNNIPMSLNSVEADVLNRNFTEEEISSAIDKLKNNKSPGKDGIIGEFLKCCKPMFAKDLTLLFNYIVEQRIFPDHWAEGLRSPIFKSGSKWDCSNYRGITVLSVFEKVFEITILARLEFVSEAFDKGDRYNGGFKKGSRTSDNNFIIQGLVQRQLHLGKSLIVVHVDFSRAFDLVNRNILFFKLYNKGYKGRVIETLFDLYRKTSFRVKIGGKISSSVSENIGVNQGGITSPFLFREYISDLKGFLDEYTGICIGKEILIHELWADDLYLVADYIQNSQKQVKGLEKFCVNNHMLVNEIKTKYMIYGKPVNGDLLLNGKPIEQVNTYKSLGTILNTIKNVKGDIFRYNTEYLNNRARSAIFGIKRKIKSIGNLPPVHMFHLYESMIEPILLYGSDLWGASSVCTKDINKIYLWFIRIVLNIKATTSNIITTGESGIIPPKVKCHINAILYFIRLNSLPCGSVVKSVFIELRKLHDMGFHNWYTKVLQLARNYGIDPIALDFCEGTKKNIKSIIKTAFVGSWKSDLYNLIDNPSLRTYSLIKVDFTYEPYLTLIIKPKYLHAFTRFRAGSHTLEIERGRYTNPRTPRENRLCVACGEVEDELHFLISCQLYQHERAILFDKVSNIYPTFIISHSIDKFIFLMTNNKSNILTWVGKFIHDSMDKRVIFHMSRV